MAKQINRLTALKVERLNKPGRHADGGNLYLFIGKDGSKRWVFIYRARQTGKQREMGLGAIVSLPLAKAREKAAEYRAMLAEGKDPLDARRQVEAKTTIPTFTQAAAAYIRLNRHGWKNYKHRMQWVATLQTYARPAIGSKPVDEVTTEDILRILQPIWHDKTETAKRVQGRLENVLDFAAARKWRDPVNPARWRGHLDKLLPKPGRVKQVRPQPAMPWQQVPAFMDELKEVQGLGALALRLLILTATRTSEIIGARWDELDIEAAIWTIPAARMKAKREHRVPLSAPALEVIAALPRVKGNPYLFFGTGRGKHLSNMAMLETMRGLSYGVKGERGPYVPHGMRSSFRDWAGETSTFPADVCEMALAHTIKNKAEAAYRRGDLFAKRRGLMDGWASYCTVAGADIVPLAARR